MRWCLFVIKFLLIEYQVGEVVHGILVHFFHEIFDVGLWNI